MNLLFEWEEHYGRCKNLFVVFTREDEEYVLHEDNDGQITSLDEMVEYYKKWCGDRGLKILQNEENAKAFESLARYKDGETASLFLKVGLVPQKRSKE